MSRNTNELLEFSKEARLLIVNIDDYGMCNSINQGALEILRQGHGSSCTLMMPCPWSYDGIRRIKEYPGIETGVHLTAISEHPSYRWGPLCSTEIVPSLLDETGRFFYSLKELDYFIARAKVEEVEAEFRRQIEAVLASGTIPTHLDSHCHGHERREDIFGMTLELSLEYGLPLRIRDAVLREKAAGMGLPVIDYDTVDSYEIAVERKSDRYRKLLKELPPGTTSEWAVHPSVETEELKRMELETWESRLEDYRFFVSPEFPGLLREEKTIGLVNFNRLKPFWKKP